MQADEQSTARNPQKESEHGAPEEGAVVRDIFTTDDIFRRIHVSAEDEFEKSKRLLFLSGLAAGGAMAFSFLGPAAIAAHVPAEAAVLLQSLLYPLGFIFVVIGRYQLFTEDTLTPVTMVLTRVASLPRLLRIWIIVLAANLIGTALAAAFFAKTDVFSDPIRAVAPQFGEHLLAMTWNEVFVTGILAGWLIAGMVWLNHGARSVAARLMITFLLMYTVGAAELAHCIVGSTEVIYLVLIGEAGMTEYLWEFEVPAVLGNVVGGVLLVAIVNYGQTREKLWPDREALSWRKWLLGRNSQGDR